MSTTVNYKGNTIATLSNETKTLTTSGKWMEADVVITDASAGIVPSGTITIDNDGTYDVTNYASAEVAIDYESKVRAITFIVNRNSDDTTVARAITVHQTFSSRIDFSNGIKTIGTSIIISVGNTTTTATLYAPKSRPIIVIGAIAAIGNFDVIIDSSYGECVDVPHILGASSTNYTKAVYLKTNAPDEFTVTINLNSQAAYPDTVLLNSLSVTSNGTYTATSGTAYSSVNVEVEPNLQSKTNINPTTSSQTITADSGYDGLSSVQINAMPTGTAGTPSASKGTVSNHQVSITPSVTNTTGYITGGTIAGTSVTVTAAELASGNKEITSNGTNIDVVGYSTVSVAVPSSSAAIITDTTDTAGGTIRTITTTDEVHLQTKTITPTSSQQTVLPDTGYDGFSSVIVGASSGGTPSATSHTIYFEFSDNTNTTITAYYDDSFISDAITATNPPVYSSKTVVLAQLDGVTWYDANDIPMNTELIDFTKSSSNTTINEQGQAVAENWYYASDYTTVATGMVFSYTASRWTYIGLYNENKTVVRVIDCSSDGTVDQSDSNLVHGTISGSQLTNVAYARLSGSGNNSYSMSLIRTS